VERRMNRMISDSELGLTSGGCTLDERRRKVREQERKEERNERELSVLCQAWNSGDCRTNCTHEFFARVNVLRRKAESDRDSGCPAACESGL
jgi:hypothetical protein